MPQLLTECLDEFCGVHRFDQNGVEELFIDGGLILAGHQNNAQPGLDRLHLTREVYASAIRQVEINDSQVCGKTVEVLQRLGAGTTGSDGETGVIKDILNSIEDGGVVVDQKDVFRRGHSSELSRH